MATENIQFSIPGVPVQSTPDSDVQRFLDIKPIGSYDIKAPGRGERVTEPSRIEAPADALVKIEYDSGLFEWLRADQFRTELGGTRDIGAVQVPTTLNRGIDPTRSLGDWVIKGLHFFGISPADALAKETAELVIKHFDGKLNTGLFAVASDGSLKTIAQPMPPDPNGRPFLVFIHGTASSTQGSFSGFWGDPQTKQPTNEWSQMVKDYGDRILALEHATFSVSPVQNAIDLAQLLPNGANLHLITHSRGGLVGELLGLGPLKPEDHRMFSGRPDDELLDKLTNALDAKKLKVAKFVRTACPAAGTILASKRMDLYLNIILNVIGLIPALNVSPSYAVFKATALELIKLRADPNTIPGIEAMMPESPLIHLLNTRGRYSDADLGVIAGDFEGSGVWGKLKTYALRAYYWEQNDFVVNTKSMSGGMERQKGVWRFFDQGNDVNHFNYFKNSRTRSHMLSWLGAPAAQPAADFARVRGVERGAGVRGSEDLPIAFLVPDVFGTHLKIGNDNIWLDYDQLAKGRFMELAATEGVQPGDVHEIYKPLYNALLLTHDTVLLPYDWRQSISDSAKAILGAIRNKLIENRRPVRFIAHGMGGLVVRELMRQDPELLKASALLMLGTPNRGSWHVARLFAGRARLVRLLALLGGHQDAEVVKVMRSFRGLIDMLPEEMYESRSWNSIQFDRPVDDVLRSSREWRNKLTVTPGGVFYVAGSAPATPSGIEEFTADGDGQVPYSLGILPGIKTWYNPDAAHGNLVSEPGPLIEILTEGKTSAYDAEPHSRAAAPDSRRLLDLELAVFFPSEPDLVNAALGKSEKSVLETDWVLRVKFAHGHLREAKYPLAVGHYVADGIVSAEAQLDRQLGGRLLDRFAMDIYPGPVGTAEVVQAPGSHPPGALIVGLGDVGDISASRVQNGIVEACLRYALARLEDPPEKDNQPRSAAFSSLLVGTSGGRSISVSESVAAIVRGAIEANRVLRRRRLWDEVRIDEIQFIELYEDSAIEAAHVACRLRELLRTDLQPGERVEFDGRLRALPGGLVRRPMNDYAGGWWRRIQIGTDPCAKNQDGTKPSATALLFETLTDSARAELTLAASQTELVNALLDDAIRQPSYDEDSAVALFELLVPNGLKDLAREPVDLILVLDNVAARYPWELMAVRTRQKVQPLAVEMGMIRQLQTEIYRTNPQGARERNALVIGDTDSDLPELPGAQNEARAVAALLTKNGYAAEPALIRESPLAIVRKLFAKDYRILHLAGHGVYNPDDPAGSGMVLAKGVYLTSLELRQLRNLPELVFINCCHLGNIDQRLYVSSPHAMAASVAQALIQEGVKAVIAAGWAVNDAAAVVFAETFYRNMLSGEKFGKSVTAARKAAHALGANNTWGAYQCYGNPDFVLTVQPDKSSWSSSDCYSRREYLDQLRNTCAQAKGAESDALGELRDRTSAIAAAVPSTWRDGEMLCAVGEAHKSVYDLDAAIEAYRDALRQPKATASVEAVEQLANVLDRRAGQLYPKEPDRAVKMWEEAELKLARLNDLLGVSSERLSLLGALWKRRGSADESHRTDDFKKAADFYKQAYEHDRNTAGVINPYPGLNWIALAYLAGETENVPKECFEEAQRKKDDPDFWQRVYRPDAMLLEHLIKGDLDAAADEVIRAYKEAFQHAAANERDSALGQLRFLVKMKPDNAALKRFLDSVSQ